VFVANSDLVARRIQLYWGIDDSMVRVVYPPTPTSSYGPSHADADRDYYFTFSRLYPSKRISEIVRAFNQLNSRGHDHRLVVGGDGPARDRLEKVAGDSVKFVGYLSEADKRRRLAECKAFIFNAYQEDFGMVPIEAMASGTPVLGVRDGFTQHQILDGRNGYTYDRSDTNIVDAVRHFEANGVAWSATDIQAFAEQFSLPRFRERMRDIVAEATEAAAIQPDFGAAVADSAPDAATPHALTDGGADE
jgi:glycosyltransferase involved in cell wall biosynthesis